MQLAFTSRYVNFVLEIGDQQGDELEHVCLGGDFDVADQDEDIDPDLDPKGFGFRHQGVERG